MNLPSVMQLCRDGTCFCSFNILGTKNLGISTNQGSGKEVRDSPKFSLETKFASELRSDLSSFTDLDVKNQIVSQDTFLDYFSAHQHTLRNRQRLSFLKSK